MKSTKYQKIWNSEGKPFKILMVAKDKTKLDPYINWLKDRYLEEQNPSSFKGHVQIEPNVSRRYVMEITTMNEEEFQKTSTNERSYDGMIFHLPGANLCKPKVVEPYEGWEQWGDDERKVKKLLFLEAIMCPSGVYHMMSYSSGDWGIIPVMRSFLEDLASVEIPVVKVQPEMDQNHEYYYI